MLPVNKRIDLLKAIAHPVRLKILERGDSYIMKKAIWVK
jgi:hypothetical protein